MPRLVAGGFVAADDEIGEAEPCALGAFQSAIEGDVLGFLHAYAGIGQEVKAVVGEIGDLFLGPLLGVGEVRFEVLDHVGQGGAALANVVEYLEPYLTDPKKWTKEQITDFSNDGLYFLAYAGIGMKKPEYIALYRRLERPESAWLGLTDLIVGRYEAAGHQTRH